MQNENAAAMFTTPAPVWSAAIESALNLSDADSNAIAVELSAAGIRITAAAESIYCQFDVDPAQYSGDPVESIIRGGRIGEHARECEGEIRVGLSQNLVVVESHSDKARNVARFTARPRDTAPAFPAALSVGRFFSLPEHAAATIAAVCSCALRERFRPALSSVRVAVSPGQVELSAIDGFRAMLARVPAECQESVVTYVPASILERAFREVSKRGTVEIAVEPDVVALRAGTARAFIRAAPNLSHPTVFGSPRPAIAAAKVDRVEFGHAARAAGAVSKRLRITVGDSDVCIGAEGESGDTDRGVEFSDASGTATTLTIAPELLRPAYAALSDSVSLTVTTIGESNPIPVLSVEQSLPGGGESRFVVMPILARR